jgi:hypothetical protein
VVDVIVEILTGRVRGVSGRETHQLRQAGRHRSLRGASGWCNVPARGAPHQLAPSSSTALLAAVRRNGRAVKGSPKRRLSRVTGSAGLSGDRDPLEGSI